MLWCVAQITASADKTRIVPILLLGASSSATTKKNDGVASSAGSLRFYQLFLLADSVQGAAQPQTQFNVGVASAAPSSSFRAHHCASAIPADSCVRSLSLVVLIDSMAQSLHSGLRGRSCCVPIDPTTSVEQRPEHRS